MANNKGIKYGALLLGLFLIQQVVAYCFVPTSLVHPYWIFIFLGVIVCFLNFNFKYQKKTSAVFFLILLIFSSFIHKILCGDSLGELILSILMLFVSYVCYMFLLSKRMDLQAFNVVFPALYVFFYITYFSGKQIMETSLDDGDLFGHSSSNSISISLNILLSFYLVLNRYYIAKKDQYILIFAIVNMILIIIQGSRMGLVVALLLMLLSIYQYFEMKFEKKAKYIFILIPMLLLFLFVYYWGSMADYFDIIGFSFDSSYYVEGNIRGLAVASFFDQLDLKNAIWGFPPESQFAYKDRTYNTFLDFWARYGLFPFLFIVWMIFRRILKNKQYRVSVIWFTPFLLYAMTETLFVTGFWLVFWFMLFFLSNPLYDNNEVKVVL